MQIRGRNYSRLFYLGFTGSPQNVQLKTIYIYIFKKSVKNCLGFSTIGVVVTTGKLVFGVEYFRWVCVFHI